MSDPSLDPCALTDDDVTRVLAGQREIRMPDAVWHRLETALSREAANRAAAAQGRVEAVRPLVSKDVPVETTVESFDC